MARLTRLSGKKLGELLVEGGVIDETRLAKALEEHKATGELLGEVLVRLGFVSEPDIAKTLATQFALPYISVSQYFISKEVLDVFPSPLLLTHQCVPLDKIGGVALVAVSGPLNPTVIEELEKACGCEVFLFVSTLSEIERTLDKLFGGGKEK